MARFRVALVASGIGAQREVFESARLRWGGRVLVGARRGRLLGFFAFNARTKSESKTEHCNEKRCPLFHGRLSCFGFLLQRAECLNLGTDVRLTRNRFRFRFLDRRNVEVRANSTRDVALRVRQRNAHESHVDPAKRRRNDRTTVVREHVQKRFLWLLALHDGAVSACSGSWGRATSAATSAISDA